jgi:nitroreductase
MKDLMANVPPTTMTVEDAIVGRQSIRAFLRDKPVTRDQIEHLIAIGARSASGSNIQPWRVWVLQGRMRDQVCADMMAEHDAGTKSTREYEYYPLQWREPYYARRRACGVGLYQTLGIAKEDKAGMHAQHGRNYQLFDAPVSLIITLDRDLERGSWLDCGMFIQTIMLAARGIGLETCAQAAIAHFQLTLRKRLGIPAEQIILCGIALGYPDPEAKVNSYRTSRAAFDEFVTWTE